MVLFPIYIASYLALLVAAGAIGYNVLGFIGIVVVGPSAIGFFDGVVLGMIASRILVAMTRTTTSG